MYLCFCWSLGCALDCCPLSRHCPLDPKAVWLPLQATVPMATFHSHPFSIWLWHIHINIQNMINNVNIVTPPCTSSGRMKECSCVVLHPINFLWFYRPQNVSMNHKENVWNVYAKSLHMCQWWVPLGLEVLCFDVSGVDTATLFYSTMQPCMISSLLTHCVT